MSYPKNGMSRGFQSDMEAHTSTMAEDGTLGYVRKATRNAGVADLSGIEAGEAKLTVEIMEEVRRSDNRAARVFVKLDALKSRLFGASPEEEKSDSVQTEPEEFSWAIRYRLRTLSQQLDELERVTDILVQRL